MAYPPNKPMFWIKYGAAIPWNEVCAQDLVYRELRRRQSSVRVPGVYYAVENFPRTYIVMELIPGKTAGQRLEQAKTQQESEAVYRLVALALSELHRIPVTPGSRPAAVSGGRIQHSFFDTRSAPIHYLDIQQLEDNINSVASILYFSSYRPWFTNKFWLILSSF
jgi:hypothetical protein